MRTPQSFLGKSGTLFFLVIISSFPPLSTDLYLPALPQLMEIFATNQAMINLTLSLYFLTYAIGLLFWGPLSDKFGRKPIMLFGMGIYISASLLCAKAEFIELLISARVLQAFGGSAVTVVATAIVKDLYEKQEREKIMATIMSLVIIAPMVAPVLGAFLLKVASWRMMFLTLAIFALFSTIFAIGYKESLEEPYQGAILHSWGRLAVVCKNPPFLALLTIFSCTSIALMAFLAAGSYIYINYFGLSEQQFSYAFSFNALFASFGPTIYLRLAKKVNISTIITICFAIIFLCGIATFFIGAQSPFLFAAICAPITLAIIATRIPGTNLMLEQQEQDTGSAVAIIQFASMICGSLGMLLVSLSPKTLLTNLAIIQISVGAITLLLWSVVHNRSFVSNNLPQKSIHK